MRRDLGTARSVPSAAAARAALRAGVELRELTEIGDIRRATAIFDKIWGEHAQVPPELAMAMAHSDNYVAAACRPQTGETVGTLVGFRGVLDGQPYLHSHVLGVRPGEATRGVGFALKLHQRAWTLHRGIETIAWTFDPLVARNAYFNVTKLGAEVGSYYQNFYGRMSDDQNGDDDSDRVLALWSLSSSRASRAADALEPAPAVPDEQAARVILRCGGGGEPEAVADDQGAELLAIEVPPDVIGMRRKSPSLAARWRGALRAALGQQLAAGGQVVAVTRAGTYLVLKRNPRQSIQVD